MLISSGRHITLAQRDKIIKTNLRLVVVTTSEVVGTTFHGTKKR